MGKFLFPWMANLVFELIPVASNCMHVRKHMKYYVEICKYVYNCIRTVSGK